MKIKTNTIFILIFLVICLIFIISLQPKILTEADVEILFNQGLSAMEKGDFQNAEQYFNIVIDLRPRNADAWYNRGTVYLNLGEYDKAAKDLDKALELDPSNILFSINRAVVYSRKGDHRKGIRVLSDCIDNNKTGDAFLLSLCYSNRGLRYALTNQFDKALEDYYMAIKLYEDNPLAHLNLAMLYQKKGEIRKALKCYKVSIEKLEDKHIIDKICKISSFNREFYLELLKEAKKNLRGINEQLKVK